MKLLDFDMSLIPEIKSGKYKVVTKNNKRIIVNNFEDKEYKEYPIVASVFEDFELLKIRYDKSGKPARIFDKSYSLMLLERGFEETELTTILQDFYGERALLGDCGGDIWKYVKSYNILEEYAKKIKELFTKNNQL